MGIPFVARKEIAKGPAPAKEDGAEFPVLRDHDKFNGTQDINSNSWVEGDMNEFQPKIIAFCCNYCAYTAADMAGSMRLNYPPNVLIVHVPCTGRVEVLPLLRAFEDGADGVYVAGCEEGSCHFVNGNIKAKRRVAAARQILEEIGMEPDRLRMYNLSASMGPRFAEIAREMTAHIRELGPSPIRDNSTRTQAGSPGSGETPDLETGMQATG